jgi:hypothetical protein
MTSPVAVTEYRNNFGNTFPFSNTCFQILLAASTAQTITVPGTSSQKFRVTFRASFTSEVWVCYNGTAVLPSAGSNSNTPYQEFIPLMEQKFMKGGDTISLISASTPMVGIQFLLIQNY